MLNVQRFNGSINGKNIHYFLKKLDNNLNQDDRVKLVKDILYTQGEGKYVDSFFEEVFEQKELINGIDTSNVKLILSQNDSLSLNDNVCRGLEKIADYILYAPDGERINKKTQYNFYPREIFENKILQKEKSIDEIIEQDKGVKNETSDEVIDFLIRKGENYKSTIKQQITSKDKSNDIIRQYSMVEKYLSDILKLDNISDEKMDLKERRLIGKIMHDIKDDQLLCKDMMNGTIYFKQVMPDSTVVDYDMFDYCDKEQIIALLKIPPRNDFDDDLACMVYDLNNHMKKISLTDSEKVVLDLWKGKDATNENIAETLSTTTQYISKVLNSIANKIINQYWEDYEDWYYLNVVKGKYKKCSKCGEVKLVSKFGNDSRNRDGYKSICRECDNKSK